ncbi:MAG TPA: hypothetical protein VD931_21455 [Baekduia sp.]|nr:hypothetical protein [Baekduia sp.]
MTLRTTTASALAATAIAIAALPAAAPAAGNELRGAPTMRLAGDDVALLQFATKSALPRGADGKPRLTIRFAGGHRVLSLVPAGRHGTDRKYRARVDFRTEPRVGAKYTVRFTFRGGPTVTRLVKLHPRSS